MTDLGRRAELAKLAHDLGADDQDVAFLADCSPAEIADLRSMVSQAVTSRQAGRAKLLAALSRKVPATLTAKIATRALGPIVAARVASRLEPDEAARLAVQLEPEFLARLAAHLDPARVREIVAALPADLIVEVAGLLLDRGDHVTLGRFLAAVPTPTALRVVADARAEDLVRVALLTEDRTALERVADGLGEDRRAEMLRAAREVGVEDDDTLLGLLR